MRRLQEEKIWGREKKGRRVRVEHLAVYFREVVGACVVARQSKQQEGRLSSPFASLPTRGKEHGS
jgi:hypothetical protein